MIKGEVYSHLADIRRSSVTYGKWISKYAVYLPECSDKGEHDINELNNKIEYKLNA